MPPEHDLLTTGLTTQAAAERLAADGPNELAAAQSRRLGSMIWKVLTEPMLLLLFACGAVYLLLGDPHEAIVLLCFVLIIVIISIIQEHKTERALDALRDLSSPRASVIRNGQQISIAGRDIVQGDLMLLTEGIRIPADGVLLTGINLSADESLLTGESLAVTKIPADPVPQQMGAAGGEGTPFVFSGALIVQGTGLARVLATGNRTAIGQIGQALAATHSEPTRVQSEMQHVVKMIAIASLSVACLLALGYGVSRHDWLNGILAGITFAMALIPEELPVILTLFLGIGAWRIARQHVLTRRIPAIEMLGETTVLCTDKTGTLTQNKMAVAQLFADDASHTCGDPCAELPETFHEVLEYAILASQRKPFDPMELAIQEYSHACLTQKEHWHDSWELVEEYPLSKELLAMSRVWQSTDHAHFVIASKGAPEAIADLCHLSVGQTAALMTEVNRMAGQGLRVLGVARALFMPESSHPSGENNHDLPPIQHDFVFELVGLIAFADPVRAGVPAAIRDCRSAGIRVIMITGDYPATARHIAAQCGIDSPGGTLTGHALTQMDDAELLQRLQDTHIFCRVSPEQKLRLVQVLQQAGETVAMTGDGVNDAPALQAAHIGIAMGKRGTDVARESAALVLLEDDFNSIVTTIRAGRRIFDNLRKTISFIIAVHIPVIGMSLIPVIAGWPLVLMPVHIMVLQLVIDPTCSLVFEAEPEEPDVMQKPPRASGASLFERAVLLTGLFRGSALLLTVLAVYWMALQQFDAGEARALAFTTMVLGNLGLIFIHRSQSASLWHSLRLPNPALWWVVGTGMAVLLLALTVPGLSQLFYFGRPQWHNVLSGAAAALACIVLLALSKTLRDRLTARSSVR
ncbi:cation-translocating P-type ATPase [Undibacterium griseum]|uniref:Cation-translocating P-type ATPase n=1 Tax=Undibacterium griseum TaxID=2762295 RepID=A0ABR6YJB3_9BURK|nr:cation-translocating P-type ATPase [Undibacterium griseum]MBC3883885.1 cation-translocating P-type ATPase [Undibacterium griseum]